MLKATGQRGYPLLGIGPGNVSTFVGGRNASWIQTRSSLDQGLKGGHDFRGPADCLLLCEIKTRQTTG